MKYKIGIILFSLVFLTGCLEMESQISTTTILSSTSSSTTSTSSSTSTTSTSTIVRFPDAERPIIINAQFTTQHKPESEYINEEWIEIYSRNCTDMTGWILHNKYKSHIYHFPRGFKLCGIVRIHTGKGIDNSTDLFMQLRYPLWRDDDVAVLRDKSLQIVSWFGKNESK